MAGFYPGEVQPCARSARTVSRAQDLLQVTSNCPNHLTGKTVNSPSGFQNFIVNVTEHSFNCKKTYRTRHG